MMNRPAHRLCLLAFAATLAACSNDSIRDTLGIQRTAPDEFEVISRPPLSVPPDFNLRPPAAPGETDANTGAAVDPRANAQTLVMGNAPAVAAATTPAAAPTAAAASVTVPAPAAVQPVQQSALPSATDSQFLTNAGAGNANPNIRELLLQESPPPALEQEKSTLEKLRAPSDNQPVVDAKAEAQRIQDDKTAGQPVTTGDTPMSTPKDTGPLGRLLGY